MSGIKRVLSLALTAALLSVPACAMTVNEARDAVLANDPGAADAREFWMYQSSETDGMWVVYATGIEKSTMAFEGGAWFVTPERAVSLGHTRSLHDWELYSSQPQPSAPVDADGRRKANLWPALYVAGGPELMVSRTDRLNAWVLAGADFRPKALDTGKLIHIGAEYGQLLGMVEASDNDYAFIVADGGAFLQIAATPIGESAVRAFPDGSKLLDQLRAQGYAPTGFLYRCAAPDGDVALDDLPGTAGSIAVNLEKDGKPWHTYFFCSRPGEALNYIDGSDWGGGEERWIAAFEGKASQRLDAGLKTVETIIRGDMD